VQVAYPAGAENRDADAGCHYTLPIVLPDTRRMPAPCAA